MIEAEKNPIHSMKLKDASRVTGLSYYTLRNLCLSKKVPSVRVGGAIYINMNKLVEFMGGTTND